MGAGNGTLPGALLFSCSQGHGGSLFVLYIMKFGFGKYVG